MIYFTRQEQRIVILLGIVMLLGIGLLLVKRFQPGWVMRLSMGEPDFDTERDEVSPRLKMKSSDTDDTSASNHQPMQATQSDQSKESDTSASAQQTTQAEQSDQSGKTDINGRININAATKEELDTLPGIGPVLAQRIIDYREEYDGFKDIRELTAVSGIGDATLQKLKDLIIVGERNGSE